MLNEGKFGPGTKKEIQVHKDWKIVYGAIENKNRPEAIYITMSTWAKPKSSLAVAQSTSTSDPQKVVIQIMHDFDSNLAKIGKKIPYNFSSDNFDTSSVIFTYDIAYGQAKPGKKQFVELEINIDTVNETDFDGNPMPNSKDGKIMNIPFKEFEKPIANAITKILNMDIFNSSKSTIDFSKSKGGK